MPARLHPKAPWENVRILEIGDRSLFADTFPDNTRLFWTGSRPIVAGPGRWNFGPASFPFLTRAMRGEGCDIIICHPPLDAPLGARSLGRQFGRLGPLLPFTLPRTCGTLALRLPSRVPLAILDTEDTRVVERHNLFLLRRSRIYFKRELPPDFWKVFSGTVHPHVPSARLRQRRVLQQGIDKLRPFSLGISDQKVRMIAAIPLPDKTTDVFFAGALGNATVRTQGIRQLRALQDQGYHIDIAEGNIPIEDYFARCARAWLSWSPEGYGWDCFRHYEAAASGSVPLISAPTISRYQPLLDGIHCLCYDVEGEDLKETIVTALQDRSRLDFMARAARDHVMDHHTHQRLCEYVLGSTLTDTEPC